MRIFRLCERRYSTSVLSGKGGLLFDGRWHSRGRPVVYCASCEALAVLEVRVHVGRFMRRPCVMHEIEVADDLVAAVAQKELPVGWRRVSPLKETQRLGDEWLESGRSVALKVPSIHSRSDWNVLLNPQHAGAESVKVIGQYTYTFDPRLFGAGRTA